MMRAARGFPVFVILILAWTVAALAAEPRRVVTSENSDYFGFDLRSEQNVTLDQCQTTCLGDSACRAFTYNTKAKWCFLKSDFATMKPFNGAVAGKVVAVDGDPDIGAPPELAFFPAWMVDEARQYRTGLTNGSVAVGEEGLAALTDAGDSRPARERRPHARCRNSGRPPRSCPTTARSGLELARARWPCSRPTATRPPRCQRDATSAAYNAYQLSRTASDARRSACRCSRAALDRRDLFRPALQAYEASLALDEFARGPRRLRGPQGAQGFPRRRAHDRRRHHLAARLRAVLRRRWSRPASTTRPS